MWDEPSNRPAPPVTSFAPVSPKLITPCVIPSNPLPEASLASSSSGHQATKGSDISTSADKLIMMVLFSASLLTISSCAVNSPSFSPGLKLRTIFSGSSALSNDSGKLMTSKFSAFLPIIEALLIISSRENPVFFIVRFAVCELVPEAKDPKFKFLSISRLGSWTNINRSAVNNSKLGSLL